MSIPNAAARRERLVPRERCLADGRQHPQVGGERRERRLEADLVVPLAGGAVGDERGAGLARKLDHLLGDQRPGQRRHQRVFPLVERVRVHRGQTERLRELVARVHDPELRSGRGRPLLHLVAVDRLPQVHQGGHDLQVPLVAEGPRRHGGVQALRSTRAPPS